MPSTFDPNARAGAQSGLFGLTPTPADAGVHVLAVPYEATASYRLGTRNGPEAILRASHQVDLFDLMTGRPYREGIALLSTGERVEPLNAEARSLVDRIRTARDAEDRADIHSEIERVNAIGAELNSIVHEAAAESLDAGKLVCVLGGDHSVPFGSIHAHAERHPGMGILHFDAHADMRDAYEGFTWSHASILHNVLERLDGVSTIVQVGIRDLGEDEFEAIAFAGERMRTLYDTDWARAKVDQFELRSFVRERLTPLPDEVYVTFDVDGLDPTLCPNTGTPVPGGLNWHETMLWLDELKHSGRRIVGLDLVEVSPGPERDEKTDSWDAIVGARLLYRLIGTALGTRV